MQAFSDLIRLFRLNVEIYHNAKVCGNWLIEEHQLGQTCFHMSTEGKVILDVPGHLTTELNAGDLVIFPRELAHTMRPVNQYDGEFSGPQQHMSFREAEGITGTGMLCGAARFQHKGSSQLLDALPPVFIVRFTEDSPWACGLLKLIIEENMTVDQTSKVIQDRLSELLFIYALRQFLADHPEQESLLSLYGHKQLSKAVEAIHRNPAEPWTLEQLARISGQSRTAFAGHFRQVSGWTVIKYLTWWRMQLAWRALKDGQTVANVAEEVGYGSEASFSRAFQKHFGIGAGKVRRGE